MNSAPANTEAYREVRLGADRVDACLALSTEAGWNQTGDDWRLLLETGQGFGLLRGDGVLVASAVLLPLGAHLSWIGMVLVTVAERRRGLATRLMQRCLDVAALAGRTPGLDATPAGQAVYGRLGFAEVDRLTRLEAADVDAVQPYSEASLRAMRTDDLPAVAAYDLAAFGTDRTTVLAGIRARRPEAAAVAEWEGQIAGYVLARDGRVATQIGPLVADTPDLAEALLAAALARTEGPVFVDLFDRQQVLAERLAALGFRVQRPFARMLADGKDVPYERARTVLASGPELG